MFLVNVSSTRKLYIKQNCRRTNNSEQFYLTNMTILVKFDIKITNTKYLDRKNIFREISNQTWKNWHALWNALYRTEQNDNFSLT